jgi:hypothetical protein
MKTCCQCYHYMELGEGKNGNGKAVQVGHCFRYPPTVSSGGSAYPIVGAVERQCGEFKELRPVRKAANDIRRSSRHRSQVRA